MRPAPDRAPAGIAEADFRAVVGRFATGVALVTARVGDTPHGLIVSSFTSVSLQPPLVAFCPSRTSLTWRRMRAAGGFAVNVLAARHAPFARAAAAPGADRFTGAEFDAGQFGAPLLRDALAVVECDIVAEHAAGDHMIVVGRVLRLHGPAAGAPLVHWAGGLLPAG